MIKALQRCRAFYFLGFLIKRLFERPAVFVYKAINSRFFKFRALLGKTPKIAPLRRSNLSPLHPNYLQSKTPNVTNV